MTVLGSRHHSAAVDLLGGSVSATVATHGSGPVVLVPPADAAGDLPVAGTDTVVVGVDGSTGSAEALAFAGEEATTRGGRLTAVYVWSPAAMPDQHGGQRPRSAVEAERMVAEAVRQRGLTAAQKVVPGADPAEVLLAEAADAALLVIGSRGRGCVEGTLLGSVGTTLVRHADRPLAIVHAATRAAG